MFIVTFTSVRILLDTQWSLSIVLLFLFMLICIVPYYNCMYKLWSIKASSVGNQEPILLNIILLNSEIYQFFLNIILGHCFAFFIYYDFQDYENVIFSGRG